MRRPKGVPKDEWLLAQYMDYDPETSLTAHLMFRTIEMTFGEYVAVHDGYLDHWYCLKTRHPNHYAAGAALAMALEGS